jgi:hypothetical protein
LISLLITWGGQDDEGITAADIAKELGVSAREARVNLRAAGIRAPYAEKDVPKMKAIIKGDAPTKDDKRKATKPKGKSPKPRVAD